jgi:hypothetical protein
VDELAILAYEAEEAPHRPRQARYRPVVNGLHLGGIHGHACLQDHVAKVGDGGDPKRTRRGRAKYGAKMTKMIHPRLVVDQDIIEEDKYKAVKKGAQYIVHECLKRGRGVAQPERRTASLGTHIGRNGYGMSSYGCLPTSCAPDGTLSADRAW